MSRTILVRRNALELETTFATPSSTLVVKIAIVNKPIILNVMDYNLKIPNKSHYLTETSRTHFKVINPKLFKSQQSKQLGYYVRVYYHYQHIIQLGGMCLFYTLTFNNKALPHFHGVPCFDHSIIQKFIRSSGFDKKLLRDYGFRLQYFVTCELGEGKGKRGFDNNPHYHVLFFLMPDGDWTKTKCFSPHVFQQLVNEYWQGPSTIDGRRVRPQNYRYGIAMPGANLGVVNSAAALAYVSKYVLKDAVYYKLFHRLKKAAKLHIFEQLSTKQKAVDLYKKHCDQSLQPLDNLYVDAVLERLFKRLYKRDIMRLHVPKVRISQGVGLYALDKVNADGVTITIPKDKKTIKTVNLPLYLYRKLYYDVVKDFQGNNKYVLNEKGINLQVSRLPKVLESRFNEIKPLLDFYKIDIPNADEALTRYVQYDIIYRNRLCVDLTRPIVPTDDYGFFCISEYFLTNYLDDVQQALTMSRYKHLLPLYDEHPYFKEYVKSFKKIDNMLNDHYICANNEAEKTYNENRRVKSHLSQDKFNQYLNQL